MTGVSYHVRLSFVRLPNRVHCYADAMFLEQIQEPPHSSSRAVFELTLHWEVSLANQWSSLALIY